MTPIKKLHSFFSQKSQFEKEIALCGFGFNDTLKQELKDLKKSNEFDKELIRKYIFIRSEEYFSNSIGQLLSDIEFEVNDKVNIVAENDLKSEFLAINIRKLLDLLEKVEIISKKYPRIDLSKREEKAKLFLNTIKIQNIKESEIIIFDDILNDLVSLIKQISLVNKPKSVLYELFDLDNSDIYMSCLYKTTIEVSNTIQRIISENNQILNKKYVVLETPPFLKPKEETKTILKEKPILTISQIALKYAYEGLQITRANGNDIAKKNGHNSGEKLFQKYIYYINQTNRKGKPTLCTAKKLKNKIELIESVIELLPTNKQEKAKDEVLILKSILDAEYQ